MDTSEAHGALERPFPGLRRSAYSVTSSSTAEYNCIAWAAGRTDVWMWPDPFEQAYWPNDVARTVTLATFVAAFEQFGYSVCDSDQLAPGTEKVALFAAHGVPQHAARQLPDGSWTSKCGRMEDISHDLHALEGDLYGTIAVILSRRSTHSTAT